MQQLQIDFFYPLTEQIPLDLNYEGCEIPRYNIGIIDTGKLYVIGSNGLTNTTISASHLILDVETTKIKVKEEPNFCRKVLYKCLGLQWEKK